MVWWHILIIVVVSYFMGNISFSRFLASTKKKDITKLGSGNAGSTNILRNFGFAFGLLNLVLDILKGFLPAFLAYIIFGKNIVYLYIAGISVMVGHIYPVVFKFKGGKGIASMLGVFLAADPIVTLIVIAVAAVSWLIFKYGSVASFICVTALTVYEGIQAKALPETKSKIICILLFVIFCLTWYAHRSNIERLLCGRESKVSLIKSTKKKIKETQKENILAVQKASTLELQAPKQESQNENIQNENTNSNDNSKTENK